jgi:tetratricopeptide (TPR) repeat protein
MRDMSRAPSRGLRLARLRRVARAALTAHRQALRAGLLFDDAEIVRDNRRLEVHDAGDWHRLLAGGYWEGEGRDLLWRPLTMASFAAQRAAGAGPRGYHAVNLLLHALVAAALFLLALRLTGDRLTSALAALLFAVHPLASEAVTLAVGRADLLVALAALLVLILLWGGRRPAARGWRLAAIFLLTAAACLAKESGFALPLLAALLAFCPGLAGGETAPGERRAGRQEVRRPGALRTDLVALAAVAGAAAVVLAARVAVLGRLMRPGLPALGDNPIAHSLFWEGRFEALRLLARGAGLFLWPGTLSVDYSHAAITVPPVDAVAVVSITAGLAALALVLWMLRRRPVALLGGLFFLAAHLLTANLITPIGTIFAERLLYLPMAGLCLLAADLAVGGGRLLGGLAAGRGGGGAALRRGGALAAALLAVGIAAALMVRTDRREREYVDDLTLWRATVAAVPLSAKARYNHGRSLAARGEHREALGEYRRSLEILPDQPEPLNNLAATLLRLDRPGEALAALDRAVEVAPEAADPAFNRALTLRRLGRREEAAREFRRGAGIDPERARELAARGGTWRELLREAESPPPREPAERDPLPPR